MHRNRPHRLDVTLLAVGVAMVVVSGAQARLNATHEAWRTLRVSHSPELARLWFVGTNPRLDDRSPLEAIREGDLGPVLAAAVAFADGTGG